MYGFQNIKFLIRPINVSYTGFQVKKKPKSTWETYQPYALYLSKFIDIYDFGLADNKTYSRDKTDFLWAAPIVS